jgi:hypothetical protein
MSDRDGFLTRWSRRKLGADPDQQSPAAPAEVSPEATEESLPEDELALLPRIEDLTPESDISGFLRKGVPDLLKKAALRRMWALDPAIRDYVGDARDYAWDWNIPGNVPCSGPLLPTEEMTARIQRMFSRSPEDPAGGTAEEAPTGAEDATAPAASLASVEPAEPDEEQPDLSSVPVAESASLRIPDARSDLDPVVSESPVQGAPLRRHGAAIPKLDLF